MPINYVVVERGNPGNPEAPTKFYGLAKSRGELTLRQLSKRIADISTVSSIDTMAVLEALLKVIPEELGNGNIIRLGDFGSFYSKLTSEGAEKRDDFHSNFIKKTSIKFRPGVDVKNVLNDITYKKAS